MPPFIGQRITYRLTSTRTLSGQVSHVVSGDTVHLQAFGDGGSWPSGDSTTIGVIPFFDVTPGPGVNQYQVDNSLVDAATAAGSVAGAAAGSTAGTAAGGAAGSAAGATAGATAGAAAGSAAGTTAGTTAGSSAGTAAGTTAGQTAGAAAGATAGAAAGTSAANAAIAGALAGLAAAPVAGTTPTPALALNTIRRPDATRPTLVTVCGTWAWSLTLVGSVSGTASFQSDTNATNPATVRANAPQTQTLSLGVGINLAGTNAWILTYVVPAGHYYRIATSGAGTFAITSVNETAL